MLWFETYVAQMARTRGPAAVWDLAAIAAICPYIIGSGLTAVTYGSSAPGPYAAALSLAATLVCLAALRTALVATSTCDSVMLVPPPAGAILTRRNVQDEPHASRNTLTGLPGRTALQLIVDQRAEEDAPAAIGLIRFANCSAMTAYDATAAVRIMTAFARRFESAVGVKRPLAQIDHDSFAVWFAGQGVAQAEKELLSIAYVVSQEIEDEAIVVAPDIELACTPLPAAGDRFLSALGRAQSSLIPLKRFAPARDPAACRPIPESLSEHFALEQALRRAVREGQLSLRYQPFVDTREGRVAGAEVLLRWRHPDLGDVSPARFVPILEHTGLIQDIGLWTLNSACRQMSRWRAAGQPHLQLAVNLSAVQLQDRALQASVLRTVAAHGLSPADVELELTETAAMEDRERSLECFRELRAVGCGIAIDDFGNGHSNLSYLKHLPFTKLKIDREFITDVDTRPASQAICKALIELGSGLGITVLAEGVERYEEVATLRRLGCEIFQGFYFAKPLTADELTEKLADPEWLALLQSDVHRSRAELQKRLVS